MGNKHAVFIILLQAFIFPCLNLAAQPKEVTVNKVFTEDLSVSSNDILSAVGEKATIKVTGWKNNYIKARIAFSATHTDKKIALQELAFMKYAISREKNSIEIRNAFILPATTDYIQSRLEVLIELMVPGNLQLMLKNKYGDVELRQLNGKIRADLEFSDMELNSIGGEFILQSSYSEIHGRNISSPSFKSEDNNSRIFIEAGNGNYVFNSRSSELDLTIKNMPGLTIDASRTNITVSIDQFDNYNYKLVNREGKIYVPEQYSSQVKKAARQNSLVIKNPSRKPFLHIATTLNNITIK